jgi:hypothetical protein
VFDMDLVSQPKADQSEGRYHEIHGDDKPDHNRALPLSAQRYI